MMKTALRVLLAIFAVLSRGIEGDVADYLEKGNVDPEVSLSKCIALQQMDQLRENVVDQFTLVLPTNKAWQETTTTCRWFKALLDPKQSALRTDVMLEVGTEAPGNWQELKDHVGDNGVIDAMSGSVYFVDTSDDVTPSICVAKWENEAFTKTKECATLKLPPISGGRLDDQHIYKIDNILVPPQIKDLLNAESKSYTCSSGEKLKC
eukprot:GHVU01029672.1.p1 GENE.GHVU01029672.1~~GHVU01029672.1.p1  ORF type:complete len:207 (+),score=28.47 GHVU01029672.1:36-656(+)